MLSAALISIEDFGVSLPTAERSLAENASMFFGLTFMLLGFFLLVDVIHSLRLRWPGLQALGKFVGVVGLFATTFVGGYIYYYFLSHKIGARHRAAYILEKVR